MAEPYTAVVAGATGAIGREVVRLLIDSPSCTQITALVRSAASAEAKLSQTALGTPIDSAAKTSKLKLVEYDWEALCSQGSDGAAASVFSGCSVAINCLGTTKKDAGGMKGWLRVDKDYFIAMAGACKQQGVSAYAVVSWAGANPKSMIAQVKAKGEGDREAIACAFPHLLILRPGLLNRGDQKRLVERIGMVLMAAIRVDTVAAALVAAYEGRQDRPAVDIMENAAMQRVAAAAASGKTPA